MNWFKKIAKDFSDRNLINEKIRYLSELSEVLSQNSKLIFQNGKMVKDSTFEIINSKKITSYPFIHDILIEANDIALDSPWKYQALCQDVVDKIMNQISVLKDERKKFTEGEKKKPLVQKGWFPNER